MLTDLKPHEVDMLAASLVSPRQLMVLDALSGVTRGPWWDAAAVFEAAVNKALHAERKAKSNV